LLSFFRMTEAPSGRLPTMVLAVKAWSAACRLGDSEAVLQHLKADNFTVGDSEHDSEIRLDDFAGLLEFGHERTKDHRSIVTGQNVVDLEADALNHGARVINEIGDSGPAGFLPDPRALVALQSDQAPPGRLCNSFCATYDVHLGENGLPMRLDGAFADKQS
jgi:hypothetical protein